MTPFEMDVNAPRIAVSLVDQGARSAAERRPGGNRFFAPRARLGTMDIYEALYTTRAMRRIKPDPIPTDVQQRILDAAVRAPTGGNTQNWRFLVVDDPGVRASLGPVYRRCLA